MRTLQFVRSCLVPQEDLSHHVRRHAGVIGSKNGTGAAASFNGPYGLSVDGAGNIYVADTDNDTIRKITSTRVVSTFAGTAGIYGAADGTGSAAQFNTPTDVTVNSAGTLLYVADYGNNEIRKITSSRVVSTFAGSVNNPPGGVGYVDGTGHAARFGNPIGIGWQARQFTSPTPITPSARSPLPVS